MIHKFSLNVFFSIATLQESVTDYTTPSSSLPNTVATNNAKLEDTLVNNVSNYPEVANLGRSLDFFYLVHAA